MIYGIGTDIVSINRIARIYAQHPTRFANKILSTEELKLFSHTYANKKVQKKVIHYLAKRFAAKEAFSKALGTGMQNGVRFKDITIVNTTSGKPLCKCTGKAAEIISSANIKSQLTISDEEKYAVAFVILSK